MNTEPFKRTLTMSLICIIVVMLSGSCQDVDVTVEFDQKIREWDGFGANYVEVRHTRNYEVWPQDYGGFKYLSDKEKQEVIDLVFGDEGLRVSLVKMFLDPYHELTPDNEDPNTINMPGFQHTKTTKNMRYFVREGIMKTRARGEDLQILAGLYAAPAFTIKQGAWGRDLIPDQKYELAEYMISWAKYLLEVEELPVKYLSLHNEEAGGMWNNYDSAGFLKADPNGNRLDRALFWPKEQIVDFLLFMREMLDHQGMNEVGLTPGETQRWSLLVDQGIAEEIASSNQALNNLGLITSHAFVGQDGPEEFHEEMLDSEPIDILRAKRPELKAWTTSCKLDGYEKDVADIGFMEQFYLQIYNTKVNGIIPWATVHCPWESDRLMSGGSARSGNQNSPIQVIRDSPTDGHFEVRKGYYFYKQMTLAGRPGMKVANVHSPDSNLLLVAWAKDDTNNPDSFILINKSNNPISSKIKLSGTAAKSFTGYITSEATAGDSNYESIGTLSMQDCRIYYTIPGRSSVVFFGNN